MKKLTFILALAMLSLLTQCKKQEVSPTETPENGIQMVLKADNGGSRTDFGPNGAIAWKTNEKIYVVANGQCIGYVCNGTEGGNTFTGTLSISSGTYDFHYYYVGNTQSIANESTEFTMDFTNQDGILANLGDFHVGYGSQSGVVVTEGETVTAQASMTSLVSMAYFNTLGMAEEDEKVYFYGEHINNQMTINFETNTPTFDKTNAGWICAGTASSGAYVMLLPNHTDGTEELPTDITFVSKRTTGTCNGVFNYGIVGGRFYCNGGNTGSPINVSAVGYSVGVLRGEFSVSDTKTVHFSQGNLKCSRPNTDTPWAESTLIWSLLDNQYDVVETSNVAEDYGSQTEVGLFGWGTSGWNNGNIYYQPYNTGSTGHSDDGYGYGPLKNYTGLAGDYANADWGVFNKTHIVGGANEKDWRVQNKGEWNYLIGTKKVVVGGTEYPAYGKAIVEGMKGLIILPNDWNGSVASSFTYGTTTGWPNTFNSNTSPTWAEIEAAGVVFLPCAGWRLSTTLRDAGSIGYYTTSTNTSWGGMAALNFDNSNVIVQDERARNVGFSVRLVCE